MPGRTRWVIVGVVLGALVVVATIFAMMASR
jgi:hypothetical protein